MDDMFMITAVQAQAYRVTQDMKYNTRAAREMVVYLDSLQLDNGLFYHAPSAPYCWGRANGWMAVGMAELLRILRCRCIPLCICIFHTHCQILFIFSLHI